MTHTPLPWDIRQASGLCDWEIYPTRDGPPDFGEWSEVCTLSNQYDDDNPDEAKLNGELIVRAVNAHQVLLELAAEALYERSRRRVSGRPPWAKLKQNDPYDMGMRQHAFDQALALALAEVQS